MSAPDVPLTAPSTLTPAEVETFLERGFLILRGALDTDLAADWVAHNWARLGMDPAEPESWGRPSGGLFLRMEPTLSAPMAVAAPRAHGAIADLVGGAERLDVCTLTDTLIMNLGGNTEQEWQSPLELARSGVGGWHKVSAAAPRLRQHAAALTMQPCAQDGWHFKHFLDTPDQALLITALFSDVVPGAGGTFIAADSPAHVARWYAQHPEGTGGDAPPEGAADLPTAEIIDACEDFVELTGSAGDVVLMHPFMLHAFSVNATDRPRIITNPAPTLKAPMRFDRHPAPSSPVEALILKALGTHSFPFEPTTPRESNFVPHHFRGEGEPELTALLTRLNTTFAAAGDSCRETLPQSAKL